MYENGGTSHKIIKGKDGNRIHAWTFNDWETQKQNMEEGIAFEVRFMNNFTSFINEFGIFM
jgi:hypothetical protein